MATGFLALDQTRLCDEFNFAMDVVDDQINVVSTGVLGLSVRARCHDHKHDPIPTRDYYALVFTPRHCTAAGNEKLTAPPTDLHPLRSRLEVVQKQPDRSKKSEFAAGYQDVIESFKPVISDKLTASPENLKPVSEVSFSETGFASLKRLPCMVNSRMKRFHTAFHSGSAHAEE